MKNRPTPAQRARRLLALALPVALLALVLPSRAQTSPGASLTAGAAAAALPAAVQPAVPAALALLEQAARSQLPVGAQLSFELGRLDPRLQPAACAQVEPHLLPGAPVWGRTRVGLRCLRGPVAWNVFLPVTVQVSAPALVATAALAAGSTVSASTLTVAMAQWSSGAGTTAEAPLADLALAAGRVLARPLVPGQAVRAGDLHARQWFAAGDMVEVVAGGEGFAVSGQGLALTPGLEGRPARVRTDSGRIVTGEPAGPRRLEVRL